MNTQRNLGLELMTTLVLALGLTACDLGDKKIGDDGETGTEGDGDGDTNCTGDDEGDGDGDGDDNGDGDGDGIGPCGEEEYTSLPSNPADYFDSPLDAFGGMSVNDILAIVEGEYAGTFIWQGEEGPVLIDFAGVETPLTVTASFAGGDAVLVEVPKAGQWVQDDLLPQLCSNRLEFGVELNFVTEDGRFNETLEVQVTALSHVDPEFSDEITPGFYHHYDLDAQQGSLAITDFDVTEGTITDFVLDGNFSETGLMGSFNVEVEAMDWVGFGGIAFFDAPRVP